MATWSVDADGNTIETDILVAGYIREFEKKSKLAIPQELNGICFQFWLIIDEEGEALMARWDRLIREEKREEKMRQQLINKFKKISILEKQIAQYDQHIQTLKASIKRWNMNDNDVADDCIENTNKKDKDRLVWKWLSGIVKLPQYCHNLMQNGFDNLEFINNIGKII